MLSHVACKSVSRLRLTEPIPIRFHRTGALAFWFGRIFCDEPAATSSENALAPKAIVVPCITDGVSRALAEVAKEVVDR